MTIEKTNSTSIQDSDASLVSAAKREQQSAFEALVKRHETSVFRVVFRITRDKEDAKDVVQQSFHKAFTHLRTFEGKSSFYSWLTRIAINEALMHLRKNRKWRAVSLDDMSSEHHETSGTVEILDSAANPEDQYVQGERKRILSSAMKRLPSSMRNAVRLQLEDKTIVEIAEILGVGAPTVKARLFRARGKLHDVLKTHFKPGSLGARLRFRRPTSDVLEAAARI